MRSLVQILVSAAVLCTGLLAEVAAQNYIIGPGDKLSISVFGRDEFTRVTEVRGDGSIRLHLLGRVEAAGRTLSEIEDQIVKRADSLFDGSVSIVVGIAQYRPIFVLGNVQTSGSYPFAPGMTVIKAIALAGGYERANAEDSDERSVLEAQRRAIDAQIRLRFAQDEQKAIAAELERLHSADPEVMVPAPAEINPDQVELFQMSRAILDETIEGFHRREALAEAETSFYSQRREIIGRQLVVIEGQLADINALVSQGLSRRERLVDLQVDVDNYRADELETLAFAAKAEQTGANAESEIGVAVTRYHRDLLREKILIDQKVELLRSNLSASMNYLRLASPTTALTIEEQMETVFEVYHSSTAGQPEPVTLTSKLQPDDVLVVTFKRVVN
ncbi:polysaccharide biosynthesis/export family protein [Parasedimentitalea psychrophila]|uniref:Polysaccharide biosynthesis/export family protein n=1 Tax=Parasedimentitalea psychrophila TaxID=2997337 RepID=A0A9Y2L4Y6_9RHOB|nr:polysaccharide biosynthesis/export family protein [Parasedimentitalea psychrophila]WIY27741.1 polysaccharide biosynthesis/export family protein [Parasedimentitalea psychrophila]